MEEIRIDGRKIVTFDKCMSEVKRSAFQGDTELCEIHFTAEVDSIDYGAFSGCKNLETADLLASCATKIEFCAFEGCENLRRVTFPDTLRYIGDSAFSGCVNLEEVVFPARITHIGANAFKDCKLLKRIVLPGHLEFVGNYAFSGCDGLEFVEIHSNVTSKRSVSCSGRLCDEEGIFRDCKNIKEVVIGNAVTNLPWNCFKGCIALESVSMPNDNVSFLTNCFAGVPFFKGKDRYQGSKLVNCFGWEGDYAVAEHTSEICDGAFHGCQLTGVFIPNSVRKIGYYAFEGYKGRGITVPPSTTVIMKTAFGRFDDLLLPEKVSHCNQNDRAVKYSNEDYPLLMNTMARCEAIALAANPDVSAFVTALLAGKNVTFYNLHRDWRLVYLTRIRGVEDVLTPRRFFEVSDELFDEFLQMVFLYGLVQNMTKKVKPFIYKFVESVFADGRLKDPQFKNRKLKLIRRLLANDVGVVKYRRKPIAKGTEWPVLLDLLCGEDEKMYKSYHAEVCAIQNVMNGIKRAKYSWHPDIDKDLAAAIEKDSPSMFSLRMDLLGQDPNGDIVGYAVDRQAGRILGVMYRRFASLREQLPLKRFILHACANWREEEVAALVGVLKEELREECNEWVDGRGADCLWYSLFNAQLHSTHGGWKRGNGLEKILMELGYRGNGIGLTYGELVAGWETIEESNARNVKPVVLEVPKRGAGRRQTTSAVGIPNQSQVHTFRREALGRTPCPEGFTNAKDFATVGGAIETWKCHENADIRRLWIPQEIKDIQSLAFKGCPNLEEIVCEECGGGEGLSIGLMTFAACPRLCRVVLPARLCGMGKGAFRDDGALMEFSVPKDHYPIVCENHLFDNCPCPDGKLAQLL